MTHPTTTGGGSTGPGRFAVFGPQLAAFLDGLRTNRARSSAAAAQASAHSSSASPLTAERREDNYRRQNGTGRLTARQQRRAGRKANRLAARAAV
ncbi:hypothetical protein [Micromonospora sp. NPDC023633]|uniref:hypothetical protein n=1 Tax=Micromonospora sp. NPDC023633 TaxID=3154320 RepID=UPI0033D9EF1E